jgi:hypothetical protein
MTAISSRRMRALRADAQRIFVARRIIACGGAARLHRGDRDALIGHRNAGDEFGGLEHRIDLARIGLGIGGKPGPVDGQVARRLRPDLRRAGDERGAGVGYPRQRLVVDGDELGGVLRRGGALADDHRHRLTDMHDPRRGECRPVRRDQRLAAAAGERWVPPDAAEFRGVAPGEHADDPGRLTRGRSVHARDAGTGMRRAHETGVGLIRPPRVGHVTALAAQENVILHPGLNRRAIWRFCFHALFRGFGRRACLYSGKRSRPKAFGPDLAARNSSSRRAGGKASRPRGRGRSAQRGRHAGGNGEAA